MFLARQNNFYHQKSSYTRKILIDAVVQALKNKFNLGNFINVYKLENKKKKKLDILHKR